MVKDLLVPEGTTAGVGTPILSVQVGADAAGAGTAGPGTSAGGSGGGANGSPGPEQAAAQAAPTGAPAPTADISDPPAEGAVEPGLHGSPAPKEKEERQAVLVGYGVKLGATKRRIRKPARASAPATRPGGAPGTGPAPISAPGSAGAPGTGSAPDPATGSVAALAPEPAGGPVAGGLPASGPGAGLSAGVAVAAAAAAASAADNVPARTGPQAVPGTAGGRGVPPAADGAPGRAAAPAVLAKPPVRKLAKDLGVALGGLTGSGPAGSITRQDVQAAAAVSGAAAAGTPSSGATAGEARGTAGAPSPAAGRLASLPREERIAIRGVRKHTAAAMTASAFTAPHVTEFLQIDITETMAAAARLRALPEFEGIRVSPLTLVAKALLVAAARHPMINSSWDDAAQEIVVKHYVNLGIAAATDRGLIVPTVKDAHALSLPGLAGAIADLAQTARAGRSTPADLSGGTITITNVGVFGVDTGTPIISPGEAAILAFGQVKDAPWVVGGQLAVRQVCTLALSFDHRIVDGDTGSAVLREVGAMLTDPLRMLAWS